MAIQPKEIKVHYARCYDPQLTPGGGLSVEIFNSETTPPEAAPTGPRLELQTAADFEQALAEAEAAVAENLGLLRLAKHFKANGGAVNVALITKINGDPEKNAKLDLTGITGVIVP